MGKLPRSFARRLVLTKMRSLKDSLSMCQTTFLTHRTSHSVLLLPRFPNNASIALEFVGQFGGKASHS